MDWNPTPPLSHAHKCLHTHTEQLWRNNVNEHTQGLPNECPILENLTAFKKIDLHLLTDLQDTP